MIKKNLSVLVYLFLSFFYIEPLYAANGFDNCPMNGDKIDVSELANVTTGEAPLKTCDAPVSAFNLTVHALGMCDSDPTDFILGNSSSDPCFYMWNTDTGDASISFGVTTSSETSFPATLPPTGVYTHGFATISATIPISIEMEFDEQKMFAGNSNATAWDLAGGPQKFVAGGDRTMRMQDFALGNYYGFTELLSESQSAFNDYKFEYDSLQLQSFSNTLLGTSPTDKGSIRDIYLIDDNNDLASGYESVTKMIIMDQYASPIRITDQINTITYKYSPRYAARMTFSPTGLGGWIVTSILFGDTQFAMEFE
jgi:hypothetical protein